MKRKTVFTLIQIAVTLGILAFLFRNAENNRQMLVALSQAKLGWIAAAFGCFGIVALAAVTRWRVLLQVQGITISWGRLAKLFLIGVLFNPVLPGGTGGDVAKIFYLLKETRANQQPAALLAVLMDRMVGLFGLIVIAGTVIAFRYDWLTQTPGTATLLYLLLAIFGGSLGFILVSFVVTGFGFVQKLPERMPMRDQLVDLAVAYGQYSRAWGSSLLALLLCVPVHLGSFTLFYCTGRAFTDRGSLMDFWGIMPIVNTITSVPISIGGAGVREGLFIQLLGGLCQISEAIAKTISLTGYGVMILWSLVGLVIYITYRPTEHAPLAEMDVKIAEIEHEIAETENAAK